MVSIYATAIHGIRLFCSCVSHLVWRMDVWGGWQLDVYDFGWMTGMCWDHRPFLLTIDVVFVHIGR